MLNSQKINVRYPEAESDSIFAARASYKEINSATPAEQREAIIREEYVRAYPWLTNYSGEGRYYKPRFMGYTYPMAHYAEDAWNCQKAEGITMLPLFPFFHYFIDFADPLRKVAIFVEESEGLWNEETVNEQDRLLNLSGWTVYRIPNKVAKTGEVDILPHAMGRCPYGEFDDDEQYQAYLAYKPQLSTETIDGFFSWLKQEVYNNLPN